MTAAAPAMQPSAQQAAPAVATFGPEPPMTEEEVDAALCLNSPLLVAEVYETTRRNVENYGQKNARLDAKATTLLGAIALSLTVAFTYGGQVVLGHAESLHALGRTRWIALLALFAAAAFAGISASISAAVALFIGDHAEISDRAIFNAKWLRAADELEHEEREKGLADYRRAVTVHLWLIAKQREQKLRKKARAIMIGQVCFLAFLAFTLCVCVEIVTRMA